MRRGVHIAVVVLCALPARGDVTSLPPPVVDALTPIDTLPTKAQLNDAFGTVALDQRRAIATDANQDFGIQLRAIRALPSYCPTLPAKCLPGTPAHDTLIGVINGYAASPQAPRDLLRLRAAVEALGVARSGDSSDVQILVPLLGHASRDIRAATARALGNICNTLAESPLHTRYTTEPIDQVRLAISTALRDLQQCVN